MKASHVEQVEKLRTRLELIEKLILGKKYKEALAEIRDFEITQNISQLMPEELLQFHYLKAIILRCVGDYKLALENGKKAFSLGIVSNNNRKIAQIQYVIGLI